MISRLFYWGDFTSYSSEPLQLLDTRDQLTHRFLSIAI
jgi:hypothetical protein